MPRKTSPYISREDARRLLLNGGDESVPGSAAYTVRLISEIERKLWDGSEQVTDVITGVVSTVPLDAARTQQLKALADLLWRRIDRVVPQLKAIELTGEEGAQLGGALPDKLVLATKLMALMRDAREHNGTVIDGELDFLQ